MLVFFLTALCAVGIQLYLLRRFHPRLPVGDEKEYLRRGAARDPFAPKPFLRVPLMPMLAKSVYLAGARESFEMRLRLVIASISIANVLAVCWFAMQISGVGGMILAASLQLFLIERAWLANHIWQDTLAASIVLLAILCIHYGLHAGILGLVVAIGFLLRLDLLVILVGAIAVFVDRGQTDVFDMMFLITPTILALLSVTFAYGLRYGIWMPDNTWRFNIAVAAKESTRRGPVDLMVTEVMREHGLASSLRAIKPARFVFDVARRLIASLGTDTFVRRRLLPPSGKAYPAIGRVPKWLLIALRVGMPLVAMTVAILLFAGQVMPAWWPILMATIVGMCLVHFRTRYRIAWVPGLVLLGALNLEQAAAKFQESPMTALIAICIGFVAVVFLVFYPVRDEV